jgi:murein DD-endopeptidase MepM/ murein hydrolase activator NlpD
MSTFCFSQKKNDEPTSYKDDLSLDWKRHNDTLKLVAKSKSLASIQMYFHSRKDNSELKSFLLKSRDSIELIKFKGSQSDSIFKSQVNDSIRVSYFLGHKSLINPDLNHPYRFPFKKGKKYEVSQSFNGRTSHSSERSKYAIDFQLDIGEPVHAARSGIVIKVIDWFTKQGGEELLYPTKIRAAVNY